MKLPTEPRLTDGPSFFASVLDWMRQAARAVNPMDDAIGAARPGAASMTAALDGPAFRAFHSVDITGAPLAAITPIVLNSESFDTANCYDTATGKFTPNVAGYYQFTGEVNFYAPGGALTNAQSYLLKNGANVSTLSLAFGGSLVIFAASGTDLVFMNGTTDYMQLGYYGSVSAGTLTIQGTSAITRFAGHLARRA